MLTYTVRHSFFSIATFLALVLLSLTLGTQLHAQEANQSATGDQSEELDAIEEIIVTGRKRGSELLQEIPASISVLGEDTLNAMGATSPANVAMAVPNLTLVDSGPGEKRYVIRGVQSSGQAQVGTYYDEVPMAGTPNSTGSSGSLTPDLQLFDTQRVEVLRGPQGTAFGANSMSGTVRYISNKPDTTSFGAEVQGRISATKSGEDNWLGYGMVNIPFGNEMAALRVVGYAGQDGGYIDNVLLGIDNVNDLETTGVRATLRVAPTEDLTFDFMYWNQDTDAGGSSGFFPSVGDLQQEVFVAEAIPDDIEIYGLTGTWMTQWATIVATASNLDRDFEFKFDSTPFLLAIGTQDTRPDLIPALSDQGQTLDQDHFELRANSVRDSSLQWQVGYYYRNRDTTFKSFVPVVDAETGEVFDPGPPTGFITGAPGEGIEGCNPCVFARDAAGTIKEQALFGEVSYNFLSNWTATVGLRQFDVEQQDSGALLFPFALFGGVPAPAPGGQSDESELIQKYNLSYRASDDMLYYFEAAQGYRLGGTNQAGIVEVPPQFDSDSLWNYEIGMKSQLLDRRLTLNAAAFYIIWEDMQVEGSATPEGAFVFTANAGEAEIFGLEFDATYQPFPELQIIAGLGWLPKAELTEDQINEEVFAPGRKGDQIPFAREFTGNLSIDYTIPLQFEQWESKLRADLFYQGEATTEFRSDNPFYRVLDSFVTVNFRAEVFNPEWNATAALFIFNAFDERAQLNIEASNFDPDRTLTLRPRTIGLEFRKGF